MPKELLKGTTIAPTLLAIDHVVYFVLDIIKSNVKAYIDDNNVLYAKQQRSQQQEMIVMEQ